MLLLNIFSIKIFLICKFFFQEGSRYNALHIAAKAMNAELCNMILTIVGNPAFVQRLYGSDSDADACEVSRTNTLVTERAVHERSLFEAPFHHTGS